MVSTYDFLVVGAGSSGSVVAARLADTGAKVGAVLSPQYPEERVLKYCTEISVIRYKTILDDHNNDNFKFI